MYTLKDFNTAGRDLEDELHLRSAPIALKLIDVNEIPEGCVQPSKQGAHYALCQAFSAVRRNRSSFALFKEDHWCLWPLISLRSVDMEEQDEEYVGTKLFIKDPQKSIEFYKKNFPMIDSDKKKDGIAIAPLATCTFEPDAIVIYCIPSQLRQLFMAARYLEAVIPQSCLQTVNSCGAALMPVLNGQADYNLAMPDAGEFERALVWDDEMIFTVSAAKLETLTSGVRGIAQMGFGFKRLAYDMNLEYPRADFYNDMFAKWGLLTGKAWTDTER